MVKRSKYKREGSPELFQSILRIAGMILDSIQVSGEYLFESFDTSYSQGNKLMKLIFPFFTALKSSKEDGLYIKNIDCISSSRAIRY